MRLYLYLRDFPATADRLDNGLFKAVHGLAAALTGRGADVTVLCEAERPVQRKTPHGYQIRCFAQRRSALGRFAVSEQLEQFAREVIGDHGDALVILNAMFHPGVWAFARVLRRCGVPYIVAPHDPYHATVFKTRRHLKWPYWYLLERPMLRAAAAVQVLDWRHEQWLRQYRVATPVIEVQNGFDESAVPDEPELTWTPHGPARLCFLGRLDAHNKGLDILIDAFAQARRDGALAQLTIQGPDWGDGELLRQRAQWSGLTAGEVTFAPPDFGVSSCALIARHDVFCLTSRFEGFSLAALEAMLAGRVLLVSDVAGIAPHVEACGCGVVVQSNAASAKDGLLRLLSLRDRWRDMGLAGRRYALENLRWDRVAEKAMDEYARILGTQQAPVRAR